MALDAVFLTALCDELQSQIVGAKIDKVQQPERDQILLSIRSRQGNHRLLLSAGTGTARVHITTQKFEQPSEPPMFCMLLRKHLTSTIIENVSQPNRDRLLVFEIGGYDEMGDEVHKKLVVEMMGQASNIILVGEDCRIIDCLRRISSGDGVHRNLLPGMFYELPPAQKKPDFFSVSEEQRNDLWMQAENITADKWVTATFSGVSPLIARELVYRTYGEVSPSVDAMTIAERERFCDMMDVFAQSVKYKEFTPVMLTDERKMKDFSFQPIKQYGFALQQTIVSGFSVLLDEFYAARDKAESMRRKSKDLQKKIKTTRDRSERTLLARREELKKSADRDTFRQFGDIIMSNIWRLNKGDKVLEAENFYLDDCPLVKIKLDPLKTPQQNAAKYYKDYNKANTAQEHLGALIEKNETELEYLNSVLDIISRAESERDLADIRRELTDTGYLRKQKSSGKDRSKPQGPMRFVSTNGYEILVGRSNAQNDELTLKTARRSDVWLHTQKIHGSHVIIRAEDTVVNDETLYEAACLAAYYSQGRDGGKIPVDYCLAKYVKKPRGSMPGMVIYTDYKTMAVESSADILEKLKK
ncbi:MAG: NFACT family protein [Oscillospiraceae bacterium]|nr:NFACT family protein [Oscillospiraceae bacterium]